MKCLVWGIGERLEKHFEVLCFDDLIGFVDQRAINKQGTYRGKRIIAPSDVCNYEYDYIVISSNKFFDEISYTCIIELGIDCKKILRLDYLLEKEKEGFYPSGMKLAFHEIMELSYNWENASIVKNWLGVNTFECPNANIKINCNGYIYGLFLKSTSISIFQVGHKKFQPIGNENYRMIGVGDHDEFIIRDNTGENIAKYNDKINECTALYWIWKHSKEKYIGLNHYRRVFESELNHGWPLQDVEALLILQWYDVIISKPVVYQDSSIISALGRQVCKQAFDTSWRELSNVFDSKSEEERMAFQIVMHGNIMFPCNMFIMDREKVNAYCRWLFPILFKLIEKVEIQKEWDEYSKRILGFWAERLFTVWLYLSGYRVKELSILLIGDGYPFGK